MVGRRGSPRRVEPLTRRAFVRRLGVVAALGTVALLSACLEWSRLRASGQRSAPSPAPGLPSVAIGLPDEPRIDLLPLLNLLDPGPLPSSGIDARLVSEPGAADVLAALLAGIVQLAYLDVPTLARAAEVGLEVLGVFQVYGSDPSVPFALDRSGIRSPVELRGRKVAVPAAQGAAVEALRASLRSGGLGLADVELVVAADVRQPLEQAAAVAAVGTRHRSAWFEARGRPLAYLARGGWEVVPGPVLACLRSYAATNRSSLTALLGGLRNGISGLLDDPAALQAATARLLASEPGPPEARRAQVDAVLVSLRAADADRGVGWASPERYTAAERYLRELSTTLGKVELAKVFVNDFLPSVRR